MANMPASVEEYFIAAGKLMHHASVNEGLMFDAFRILSGCSAKTARAIFYTLDSFPGRKALLNRVGESAGDAQDKVLVDQIISASEKANNQRREVAHALIVHMTPELTVPLKLFNPKSGREKLVSKEWLSHIVGQSRVAIDDCLRAYGKLCQKHGVSQKPDFG